MADKGVTSAVDELMMKEAALAAVIEEVLDMRHALTAVQGELAAVKGELVVVKGKLEAVECELAVVKGELRNRKDAKEEKLAEGSQESGGIGLRGKNRKRKHEITADVAREEERRREVQELNESRTVEEPAACEEGQMMQDLKMDVELQVRESEGDQKMAWEVSVEQSSLHHKIPLCV
ncbi:unnamed protein product [Closterium sp. NIES-65]|nr:unnamed protein product [Closterium sp. NIES-65]